MRPDRESYFLSVAAVVATRSTCPRLSVGAVLVRDNSILATGYNGAPSGKLHCEDVGCFVVAEHCERVIHAELNAVLQAALHGHPTDHSTAYTTHRPCFRCEMYLRQAGVSKFIWAAEYGNEESC